MGKDNLSTNYDLVVDETNESIVKEEETFDKFFYQVNEILTEEFNNMVSYLREKYELDYSFVFHPTIFLKPEIKHYPEDNVIVLVFPTKLYRDANFLNEEINLYSYSNKIYELRIPIIEEINWLLSAKSLLVYHISTMVRMLPSNKRLLSLLLVSNSEKWDEGKDMEDSYWEAIYYDLRREFILKSFIVKNKYT